MRGSVCRSANRCAIAEGSLRWVFQSSISPRRHSKRSVHRPDGRGHLAMRQCPHVLHDVMLGPSVMLQKSLAPEAGKRYIQVHGQRDQEVATASGGPKGAGVLGSLADAASTSGGASADAACRFSRGVEPKYRGGAWRRSRHRSAVDSSLRGGRTEERREGPRARRPAAQTHSRA